MPRNSLLAVAVLIGACGPPGGASSDEVGNPPPATTATDPGEAPSPMPPHSPPPAAGDRDPPATAPTEPAAPVDAALPPDPFAMNRWQSRVGGQPEVEGLIPSSTMADEISLRTELVARARGDR